MSSPVQLSDLDLATVADDADLALIRKSDTTDYKIVVSNLRNINMAGLAVLSTPPTAVDLMMISQAGTNRQAFFGSVGFIVGTKMWFYQGTAPNGASPLYWQIITNSGDRLLAVVGGSTYVTPGAAQGTWTQANHTLTTAQIPSHTHRILKTKEPSGSSNALGPARGKVVENATPTTDRYATSEATGGGGAHNHGSTWRPVANVGILAQKVA